MLSFHFVREAIAAGYIVLTHIPGKINPTDILSKHWGFSETWPMLKALLFTAGDTTFKFFYKDSPQGSTKETNR